MLFNGTLNLLSSSTTKDDSLVISHDRLVGYATRFLCGISQNHEWYAVSNMCTFC